MGQPLASTHDDALISNYRSNLRETFGQFRIEAQKVQQRCENLFATLNCKNPYETELNQIVNLYSHQISAVDDITQVLHALKEAFSYQAYDTETADSSEVDDLASRLKNYSDLKKFLEMETEIRGLHNYCTYVLPSRPELKALKKIQESLCKKTSSLQHYVDSETKLRIELIGARPPLSNESETFNSMIHEYSLLYISLHDALIDTADESRKVIDELIHGEEMKALVLLEKITALKPPVSPMLKEKLLSLSSHIISCASPSKVAVTNHLLHHPVHDCGIEFANYETHRENAVASSKSAREMLETALRKKMEVFFNETIREKLKQGAHEPVVGGLMKCTTAGELKDYLIREILAQPSLIEIINRYLKKIVIKPVKLSDFKPLQSTVEREDLEELSRQFREFLRGHIDSMNPDSETIAMLKIE